MQQKYVYCNPFAAVGGSPLFAMQLARTRKYGVELGCIHSAAALAAYIYESKFSFRLRLGCYSLPFPVRLVCPILHLNRHGWKWALPPGARRRPFGLSRFNHYHISTYLPIFQSPLRLSAWCLGWGRPRGVAYSAAASRGSPGCYDTVMKPLIHTALVAFLLLYSLPRTSLCFAPRRRQRYVFPLGIVQ